MAWLKKQRAKLKEESRWLSDDDTKARLDRQLAAIDKQILKHRTYFGDKPEEQA